MSSAENFKKALQLATTRGNRALFVFDVDSTLFCMKYRTQAIIESCICEKTFSESFSDCIERLKKVQVKETDWSVEEILSRYQFQSQEPVVSALQKCWKRKFFSSLFLDRDRPYKGCADFVRRVFEHQSKVFYLTARNTKNAFEGTLRSLRQWKFPLETEQNLFMKEDFETQDALYKTQYLKKWSEEFEEVLFFENEPVILNEVARNAPTVHLFWMNSAHSRREKPPTKALSLSMDYKF